MSQQPIIDCLAFVRDSGVLEREVELTRLERVVEFLASVDGAVTYRLEGLKGERRQPQLRLQVQGNLQLRCQRCLEPVPFAVDIDIVLELVREEVELTEEEIEDDGKDYLPLTEALDVVQLVEDELLLSLPLVPRHEVCDLPASGQADGHLSAFAQLAGLKSKLN